MESEKENAYLNPPRASASEFRKAIIAIIIEAGGTTIDQIKAMDPVKLLEKAEETTTNDLTMRDGLKTQEKVPL